jgi:hypothetical protein
VDKVGGHHQFLKGNGRPTKFTVHSAVILLHHQTFHQFSGLAVWAKEETLGERSV